MTYVCATQRVLGLASRCVFFQVLRVCVYTREIIHVKTFAVHSVLRYEQRSPIGGHPVIGRPVPLLNL